MSEGRHWKERLLRAIPFLLAMPILLWQASYFLPYMCDDSLIVARYVERFIEGHGLTWTDGERVEGYSNLLWTVSAAAIAVLGIDVLQAMRMLGVACMLTTLLAFAWAYAPRSIAEVVPPTVAACMFASAGPVGVWSIGGLEQPMVAATLAWALVVVFPILDGEDPSGRRALLVGVPLGLLCWTRPDGPLFTAVFAGVTVLLFQFRRTGWILALRMTMLPVLAVALQLGFRLIYYGDWLPNPAYIKARVRVGEGVAYLVEGLPWMVPALVLVVLGVAASFLFKHQRGRMILLLCCFVAWASYVVAIGGDIFHGRRHWVPLWVLLSFMVAAGVESVIRRNRVWLTIVVAISSLALVGWLHALQRKDPKIRQAKHQIWQWEGEVLGRVLGDGFRAEQPVVAVTAAGTIPWFSKLPALDMLGLNDRHIARQRPEQAGDLAHDHADGGYVLDREPDLIVFSLGIPAGFDVGRDMLRDERFQRDYISTVFRGYVPHERGGLVYIRTYGKVGMQIEDDLVTVPGYLLAGKGMFALPGLDGGIETLIPSNASLKSPMLPLGPGTWRATLVPPNANVELRFFVGKTAKTELLTLENEGEQVWLKVSSRELSTVIGTIHIERVPSDTRPSKKPVARGPSSYTIEPFGTFEAGLDGWVSEGAAFKQNPVSGSRGRQTSVTGNVGMFVNSHGSKRGDKVRGHLTSQPFTVTAGMALGFRVGGGVKAKVGVRLMEGTRKLISWHGEDTNELAEVRFDLTPYVGRTLHIEIYDESTETWGRVLADEFVLMHPATQG